MPIEAGEMTLDEFAAQLEPALEMLVQYFNEDPDSFRKSIPRYLRMAARFDWQDGLIGMGYIYAITLLASGRVPAIPYIADLMFKRTETMGGSIIAEGTHAVH